jgi:hypothetical protein
MWHNYSIDYFFPTVQAEIDISVRIYDPLAIIAAFIKLYREAPLTYASGVP